jgi:hypothetical protein
MSIMRRPRMVLNTENKRDWTKESLVREIAELEALMERAKEYDDDIDVRWARQLFTELLQRRREMLKALVIG